MRRSALTCSCSSRIRRPRYAEVARILRSGGRSGFTTWEHSGYSARLGAPQLADHRPLLAAAGFDVEMYEEPPDWQRQKRVLLEGIIVSEPALAEERRQRSLPESWPWHVRRSPTCRCGGMCAWSLDAGSASRGEDLQHADAVGLMSRGRIIPPVTPVCQGERGFNWTSGYRTKHVRTASSRLDGRWTRIGPPGASRVMRSWAWTALAPGTPCAPTAAHV